MFCLPSGFQCFIECIVTLQNQPENHSFGKTEIFRLILMGLVGFSGFSGWVFFLSGFLVAFFLIWAAELIITIYFLKCHLKVPSNTNPNTAQQTYPVHKDLTNCTEFT